MTFVALLKAADRVKAHVERIFIPYDITGQQYNVLRILRGAEPTGLPTLEVAERMLEQTPGITRMIDRLEAKKLVQRTHCRSDRRVIYCRITKKGLNLLAELDSPVDETNDVFRGVTKAELEILGNILSKLIDDLASRPRNIGGKT